MSLCRLSLLALFIAAAVSLEIAAAYDNTCACTLEERPDLHQKAATARWMVHSLDWGVLSTISSRLDGDVPVPFGNVYSFVDGSCDKSTGIPYLLGTFMDQSFQDSKGNDRVALTLSEASLSSVCADREGLAACTLGTKYGDPENPVCARLTLTGKLVVLEKDSTEYDFAQEALFERHGTMEDWPRDHNWVVAKIDIQDVWLIDFFGGASIIDPSEYFAAGLGRGDEADSSGRRLRG